jgi:RHS repeat-associated protein
VTRYSYDELGNQLTQADALNRTTRYEYDKLSRRTKRTLPLGQVESYSYNTLGNLTSRTDFKGKTTTYSYDVMNRLLAKTPDASLREPSISFTYNALGQRVTMSDVSGVTTYSYDSRNRLTSKQTPQGTLTYSYDNGSNLLTTHSSNVNGASANYSYDNLNRLSSVTGNASGARAATGATSMSYDAVGNLASFTAPNGVQHSYTYNSLNRLTNLSLTRGVTQSASFAYTLGAAGNRLSVTEQNGRVVTYSYDNLYRLTSETISNDPVTANNGGIGYNYDAVGNRLSRTSSVAAVPSSTSTFDNNDRLTGDAYDANGNTITSNNNGYQYDFENRLLKLNAGTPQEVSYVYDGNGNRVSKTTGGVTTKYLVDTNNLTGYAQVVEELVSGTVQRVYVYGHTRLSQQQVISGNWQASFYGYDGHGSVCYLTDANGAVTDSYTYDAFGVLIHRTGTTPNDYLYAGEQFDAALGMYYNRARYLNTATGRFFSMDWMEGIILEPLSLHKYLYAQANSVNRRDPSGNVSIIETTHVSGEIQKLVADVDRAVYLAGLKIKTMIYLTLAVGSGTAITLLPYLDPSIAPEPEIETEPEIEPIPVPPPPPDTDDDDDNNFVNIDTGTATALSMVHHPDQVGIITNIRGRGMVMCQTAIAEFQQGLNGRAGPTERLRGSIFLHRIIPILDNPSVRVMALPDAPDNRRLNDKIIFGTGDTYQLQTFTGDGRFVRYAENMGVIFNPMPFIHRPARYQGL